MHQLVEESALVFVERGKRGLFKQVDDSRNRCAAQTFEDAIHGIRDGARLDELDTDAGARRCRSAADLRLPDTQANASFFLSRKNQLKVVGNFRCKLEVGSEIDFDCDRRVRLKERTEAVQVCRERVGPGTFDGRGELASKPVTDCLILAKLFDVGSSNRKPY